jgi:hypothetical protein
MHLTWNTSLLAVFHALEWANKTVWELDVSRVFRNDGTEVPKSETIVAQRWNIGAFILRNNGKSGQISARKT